MRTPRFHVLAVLGGCALAAVVVRAQNTVGTARLESGGLRLLHGPTVAYPEAARAAGIEGTVVVEASLDAKGHVLDAHVLSGPSELRASALRSILDDHFASNTARQVQLSVIFTLQRANRAAAGRPSPPNSDDVSSPIASIECPVLPADLCRDVRQLLASAVGNPLTPEQRASVQKELLDLDDHLRLEARRTPAGLGLLVWMPSTSDVPGGIVGGVAGGLVAGGLASPPPPPPPPPLAPVRVGGNIKAPAKNKDVQPVYPAIAQSARVQGVVIVELTVGPSGSVQDARVLRSIPLLDAAALDAVRQWQYAPTLLNGVAVPVIMTATVNFSLPNP
jgi:protein TonB